MMRSPLALPLLLAAACRPDAKGGDTAVAGGTGVSDIEIVPSDAIATVVTVRWTTDEDVASWIRTDAGVETPATTGTEHEAVVLGLTAEADHDVDIVVDGETAETVTLTTGALPGELPALSGGGEGNDRWLAVPLLGSVTMPVILDPAGEVVWYWPDDSGLDVYRVRPSLDGTAILYNQGSVSGDPEADSAIVRVALDGSTSERIAVPYLAHDFVELSDGTLGALTVKYDEVDGTEIKGNAIVETAPDGTQSEVWSALDCFDPATDWGDDSEYGWTFANALDYDPDLDRYYVSLRNFSTIVAIDRATGDCLWGFGGVGNDFDISGSSFLHEHQFEVMDDKLLVFDNDGAEGQVSRVVQYDVDWDARTAELSWTYTADPTVYSFVLGDVARLDGGDTVVTWSVGGQIDRVDAEANLLWRLNTSVGTAFGFDTVMPSPYGSPSTD